MPPGQGLPLSWAGHSAEDDSPRWVQVPVLPALYVHGRKEKRTSPSRQAICPSTYVVGSCLLTRQGVPSTALWERRCPMIGGLEQLAALVAEEQARLEALGQELLPETARWIAINGSLSELSVAIQRGTSTPAQVYSGQEAAAILAALESGSCPIDPRRRGCRADIIRRRR